MKPNPSALYEIHFREFQRPHIANVLHREKNELEEELDLAKCDEDEDKAEEIQEKLWTIEMLLDQIDARKEEVELESESDED